MHELFETNDGCQFPCFWGIIPGETDFQSAANKLGQFADEVLDFAGSPYPFTGEVLLPETELESWRIHYYPVEGGIVQEFGGRTSLTPLFLPATILQTYGPPAEIYLVAGGDYSGAGSIPFVVTLFYPQHKFWLAYGTNGRQEDGNYTGCFFDHNNPPPNDIDPYLLTYSAAPYLVTWGREGIDDLVDAPSPGLGRAQFEFHLPLVDATGLNISDFVDMFSDPDTPLCLETPVELWLEHWSGG